jgi:2-acylglycerol O-acyltransferase 2
LRDNTDRRLDPPPRLLKTSLIIIWGRWGLPVPFRVPLLYAVGEPLELLHKDTPTAAEVDAAHEQICRAFVELFDRYKWRYGWGHKTLNII